MPTVSIDVSRIGMVPRRGPLSNEDERALITAWQERSDRYALQVLLEANAGFVYKAARSVARRWNRTHEEMDIRQHGFVGTIEAASRFDVARDVRFITYAAWWIKNHMVGYVHDTLGGALQLGRGTAQSYFRFKRTVRRLVKMGLDKVEARALATDGLSNANRVAIARIDAHDDSLDAEIGKDATGVPMSLHDTAHDEESTGVEVSIGDDEVRAILTQKVRLALAAIGTGPLAERARDILRRHIMSDEPENLEQIGRSYDLSRERIRQVEVQTLNLLRRHFLADAEMWTLLVYNGLDPSERGRTGVQTWSRKRVVSEPGTSLRDDIIKEARDRPFTHKTEFVARFKQGARDSKSLMALLNRLIEDGDVVQQQRRKTMDMSNGATSNHVAKVAAIFIYGDEQAVRRNGTTKHLATMGLDLVREHKATTQASVTKIDMRSADIVIFMPEQISAQAIDTIRSVCTSAGKRAFGLSHQRSSESWRRLREYVTERGVQPIAEAPASIPEPEPVRTEPPRSSLARSIEETEQLAHLALEGEKQAKAMVANLQKQLEAAGLEIDGLKRSSGVVIREQLAGEVNRKEQERLAAKRETEEVRKDLTQRVEMAERERKVAEEELRRVTAALEQTQRELGESRAKMVADPVDTGAHDAVKKVRWALGGRRDGMLDDAATIEIVAKAVG